MDIPVTQVDDGPEKDPADSHFQEDYYKKLGKRKKTDYSVGAYDEFWKQNPPGKAGDPSGAPDETTENTGSVLRRFDDGAEEDGEGSEVRRRSDDPPNKLSSHDSIIQEKEGEDDNQMINQTNQGTRVATLVGTGSNEHASISMNSDAKNQNRDAFETGEHNEKEQKLLQNSVNNKDTDHRQTFKAEEFSALTGSEMQIQPKKTLHDSQQVDYQGEGKPPLGEVRTKVHNAQGFGSDIQENLSVSDKNNSADEQKIEEETEKLRQSSVLEAETEEFDKLIVQMS